MIGFAGLSHLGIVSSVAAASMGCDVVGYDPDGTRVVPLAEGRPLINEPGLSELLVDVRPRLRFTADAGELADCDVIYISRDVPTDRQNKSDLAPVRDLLAVVARQAPPAASLVILSQVPPGFTRVLSGDLKGARCSCPLFYQVETLIFGRAVERATRPERFVVGCEDPAAALPASFLAFLASFGCPVLKMGYESAELAKIAINLFLVASISTTNMLSEVCETIGGNWSEIAPALRLDRRIGPHAYLTPGLGLAGGNLERDLITIKTLAAECGADAGIVDAWIAGSRHRREWVLKTLHAEIISRIEAPVVGVWGLAYKENTASTKNSAAIALIEALRGIRVQAYDSAVAPDEVQRPSLIRAGSPLDSCRGADALAIMTPWPEFSEVDVRAVRDAMRGRVIVDPFGMLDARHCEALGVTYFRLGAAPLGRALHAC